MNHQQRIIAIAGSSAFVLLVGVYLYLRKQRSASSNNEDDDEGSIDFADLNVRGDTASASQTVLEVNVPSYIVGRIIGKGGSNIKQLKAKYGVRFDFDKEDLKKDPTSLKKEKEDRTLFIRGERDKVQAAELGVKEIIANTPKYIEEEIFIPIQSCGRVIGKGGKTVRDMCNVSRAKIVIDRNQDMSLGDKRRVCLSGSTVQVDYAKLLIEEKIEEEKADREKYRSNKNDDQLASSLNFMNNFLVAEVPDDGSYFKVFVSAIDRPDHIWIQVVSKESVKLDEMTKELTEHYSKFTPSDQQLQQGKVGDICAAPFDEEEEWYRACIIKINGDATACLRYIDFGDIRNVHLNNLKVLKVEYQRKPAYAVESYLPIHPSGNTWSEESLEELQKLTFCAQWLPLMAKVIGHKYVQGHKYPVLDLVNTSDGKDMNIVKVMVSKGHALKPSNEANTHETSSAKQGIESNNEEEAIGSTSETLLNSANEGVSDDSHPIKDRNLVKEEACVGEDVLMKNSRGGETKGQDDIKANQDTVLKTSVLNLHVQKKELEGTNHVQEDSVVKGNDVHETQASIISEQETKSVAHNDESKTDGHVPKDHDSQRQISTESDDFVDIDLKTVDGAITAIVSEHIPTETQVENEYSINADQTVVDEESSVNDELQKSLDETSRKNVLSSMELSRNNLLTISNDDVSMNDSFATARSELTLTDTDETNSFLSAQERLTPVNDISVSVPDLLLNNSTEDITPKTTLAADSKRLGGSQFQIQFIDEKTQQVVSSESLTASFELSSNEKKIGQETTV